VRAPSIDPISDKNKDISQDDISKVLNKFGINPEKPIITQVGRFDPWKDPLGVIDVYRLVKKTVPDVQLLLIAGMAKDDPEGWTYFEKTARHAGDDKGIHLLTDFKGVNDLEVNAFQRGVTSDASNVNAGRFWFDRDGSSLERDSCNWAKRRRHTPSNHLWIEWLSCD
jgi:trehalose synthase